MITPSQALNEAFEEEMTRDSNVFIIGEEVGKTGGLFKTTTGLLDKFGFERVLDTPISEIGFTGLAVGASFLGLRPIVEFMNWNFSLQAIDHIVNGASKISFMSGSKIHCPIVFRGPAGFSAGSGAQHTQEFFVYFGSIPGLKVVSPYTASEHKGLMKSAIRDNGPVVFLENEMLYKVHETESNMEIYKNISFDSLMPLDKARILKPGSDITIIGVSLSLKTIENAVKTSKYSVEIINLISLNPIDYETIICSVSKTRRLIIVDHSCPNYSLAHEISAIVYERIQMSLLHKIICLTGKDTYLAYSASLEKMFYPSEDEINKSIAKAMESSGRQKIY